MTKAHMAVWFKRVKKRPRAMKDGNVNILPLDEGVILRL